MISSTSSTQHALEGPVEGSNGISAPLPDQDQSGRVPHDPRAHPKESALHDIANPQSDATHAA